MSGPVLISIAAVDPSAQPDKTNTSGEVGLKSLFPRYEIRAELPKSSSTRDIDVPASAAAPKPKAAKGNADP